jgi:hypothetical protein
MGLEVVLEYGQSAKHDKGCGRVCFKQKVKATTWRYSDMTKTADGMGLTI